MVFFEDGLGMGIVVNGRLFRDANGIEDEFAHMVVEPDGEKCYCGNPGCLGAYAGITSIIANTQKPVKQGKWRRNSKEHP